MIVPRVVIAAAVVGPLTVPAQGTAQDWNSPAVLALVNRSIEQRAAVRSDSGLRDYRARAHGFVFFLGQLGELSEPPRLIKSDQLELEVYWKAPASSKQRIIGWRDRADLPTDIRYHRDHLGIVTNNFSDRIGLGHEEEVRNVPHPLSPQGAQLYDFALTDSLTIRLPQRAVRVYSVRVRPKNLEAIGVIGTLYIDVAEAELVQMRFNFTRNSYVDDTLEDITILLENSLWEGRYWLPRRQELEIRRRTSWLDLPARGIIRGRWEIDSYQFNLDTPEATFLGPEIVAAPRAERDSFPWQETLDAEVRAVSDPQLTLDLAAIRSEVKRLADDHVLTGLGTAKLGARNISDLVRFNGVEGLALGFGGIVRPLGGAAEIAAWVSYGTSDKELKGRLELRRRLGRFTVGIGLVRQLEDIVEEPAISPALNSILAQELAQDYGDYHLAEAAMVVVEYELGPRTTLSWSLGAERSRSVAVAAVPARGTFDPNPELGAGSLGTARVSLRRRSGGIASGRGIGGGASVEAGAGEGQRFLRVRGDGRVRVPVGSTNLATRVWAGWGSADLPLNRSFLLGGRGDLVSEPFRAWGGRYGAFGSLEWRVPVPFVSVPLGAVVSTGDRIFLAPFIAAGAIGGDRDPWQASDGVRAVAGLGFEWFHSLFRVDLAVSLRDPRFGVVADINRGLWGIL